MNKTFAFLALAVCLLSTHLSHAQAQQNGRFQRVEAVRIAYITKRLNLNEATATKFWPIYNRYVDEARVIYKERKALMATADNPAASDADLEKAMNGIAASQQKLVDLQARYRTEFLKVLTARQLLELYKIERDFKERLEERMQQRGGGNRRPRGARQGMRRE